MDFLISLSKAKTLAVIFGILVSSHVNATSYIARTGIYLENSECKILFNLSFTVNRANFYIENLKYPLGEPARIEYDEYLDVYIRGKGTYGTSLINYPLADGEYVFSFSAPGMTGGGGLLIETIGNNVKFEVIRRFHPSLKMADEKIGECLMEERLFRGKKKHGRLG